MGRRREYFDNLDVTENRIGRGGRAASGAFGDVPQEVIDYKYEVTDLYENEEEVDLFHRSMLTFGGPDPQNFEHEQTRYDNHSEERLNVRYQGARSEFKPYHPEIFTGFTERDPRGTATDPDMRKLYDQSRFRGRYIRYYNDSDHSIPESGRDERDVIYDKRKMFYPVKNRMKWFSTSKDGRHNGGALGARMTQDINNLTTDGELIDLNKGRAHIHRGDKTTIKSNYLPMGWYRTTDHEFKVAHYGKVYKNMEAGDIDLRRAKGQAHADHSEIVEYRGSAVPKALVQRMKRIATERTENLPAHFQLSMEEKIRRYQTMDPKITKRKEESLGSQDMVDAMVTATKRSKQEGVDASGAVKRASENTERERDNVETLINPMTNSSLIIRRNDEAMRRAPDVMVNGKSMEVHSYTGATLKENRKMRNESSAEIRKRDGSAYDHEVNPDRVPYEKRMGRKKNTNRKGDFDGDGRFLDSGTLDRYNGKLENKAHTRSMMDYEDIEHLDF